MMDHELTEHIEVCEQHPLAAARRRIEELEGERDQAVIEGIKNASPDYCPVTGLPFFAVMPGPKGIRIATYGGPTIAYSLPWMDAEGQFNCYEWDGDHGGWGVDPDATGVYAFVEDHMLEQFRDSEQVERVFKVCGRLAAMRGKLFEGSRT